MIDNQDGIQLYEDKAQDEASKSNYFVNICICVPAIVSLIGYAYWVSPLATFLTYLVWYFLPGVAFMWTFTEYYFHRFELHQELNLKDDEPANGKHLAELFSRHIHHHVFMN